MQVVRRQKGWAFPVSEIIAAVEEYDFKPQVIPIYEVEGLKHWHTSRMVLIGDAAHGAWVFEYITHRELNVP